MDATITLHGPIDLLRTQCYKRLRDAFAASPPGTYVTVWKDDAGMYDLCAPGDEARLSGLGVELFRAREECSK